MYEGTFIHSFIRLNSVLSKNRLNVKIMKKRLIILLVKNYLIKITFLYLINFNR